MDEAETEPLMASPYEMCEDSQEKKVSILILGRAGSGKTALANSIANKEVGKEMDGLDSETTKLVWYKADRVGVDIEMWDTPGLQGNDTPDLRRLLYDLREKERQCDVVVYCVRMDAARLEKLDIENFSIITQELGVEFWRHTVIALTFANLVLFKCPPDHRQNDASMDRWFQSRYEEWQNQLRSTLSKAGVPEQIVTRIPFLPVGHHKPTRLSPNPWPIPCDQNWLLSFVSAINKLSNDAFIMLIDQLQQGQDLPRDAKKKPLTTCARWLQMMTRTRRRMLVTSGIGGGIGAGVGLATGGIIFGPVGTVVGGVVGGIGGALGVYASLRTLVCCYCTSDNTSDV